MRIVSWAMSYEKNKDKFNDLIDTARVNDVEIELIGKSLDFVNLKQKLFVLSDWIEECPSDEIVVCLDGFDVMVNRRLDGLEEYFNSLNTKVLISSEKTFTYQYGRYLDKFEAIESPYRYINSGTYMGTRDGLKEMLDKVLLYGELDETTIDQGLVGMWVYENLDNPEIVKMDTECEVFWVLTDDWLSLNESLQSSNEIINNHTGTYPYFIHNVCNLTWPGKDVQNSAYNIIINRK